MQEKIESCPWCGCVPQIKDKSDITESKEFHAYVCPKGSQCDKSRMVMGFFGTRDEAVGFWNNRVDRNR